MPDQTDCNTIFPERDFEAAPVPDPEKEKEDRAKQHRFVGDMLVKLGLAEKTSG